MKYQRRSFICILFQLFCVHNHYFTIRYWIAGCFEAASGGLQFYPVRRKKKLFVKCLLGEQLDPRESSHQ